MKIGFTYDLKSEYELKEGDPKDKYAEFDNDEVIALVENALKEPGHTVVRIGNGQRLLDRVWLKKEKFDIIFNISEGINFRSREAHVPAILEMLNIPYVGSDPLTLALALDKLMTKKLVAYHGIPTPKWFLAHRIEDLENFNLKFPAIVKPRYEGTSKGLDKGALVRDFESLKKRVSWLINTYNQSALIEEFIRGKEFTVGVIGDHQNPQVLPPVQITILKKFDLGDDFYIHSLVASTGVEYVCPAKVSSEMIKKLEDIAGKAYSILECRDFGRIDIRSDQNDNLYFLECNPLPSLSPQDIWPIVAKETGLTFNQMVNKILSFGCKRYGITS